jgi:hypothetical protein
MASAEASSGRQDDPNNGKPASQAKLHKAWKARQKQTTHLKEYTNSFLEAFPNARMVMMLQSPNSQNVLLSIFHNMGSHSEATRVQQLILERWAVMDGALCKVVDLHEALAPHATVEKLDFLLRVRTLLKYCCKLYACRAALQRVQVLGFVATCGCL